MIRFRVFAVWVYKIQLCRYIYLGQTSNGNLLEVELGPFPTLAPRLFLGDSGVMDLLLLLGLGVRVKPGDLLRWRGLRSNDDDGTT